METLIKYLYLIASDPRNVLAALALIVSFTSLTISLIERTRVRIESVLQGLRGDRESIAYTALQIRLTNLLSKRKYRHALISALMFAWNFEDSDRARASVLTTLLEAKRKYPKDYDAVIQDLTKQYQIYGEVIGKEQIEKRGMSRLVDVLYAVNKATEVSVPARRSAA